LKKLYNSWNASGKNLQVIVVSADSDAAGFNKTMNGFPWVALPLHSEEASKLESKIPCTQYPTPGVVSANGTVITANAWG
jgi:Thioredoxin-like